MAKLVQKDGLLQICYEQKFLKIDFVNDKKNYFKPLPKGKNELISRAVGLNKNSLNILDATAGLLQDSFMLARLGGSITAIEKSDLIYALLADAYDRAINEKATQDVISKIKIIHADAFDYLSQLNEESNPDVIYLDPMFPETKKTALPRLEMQIFRKIVDVSDDYRRILQIARAKAKLRIVVKRPLKGEPLDVGWHTQLKGTTVRFDIYAPLGTKNG